MLQSLRYSDLTLSPSHVVVHVFHTLYGGVVVDVGDEAKTTRVAVEIFLNLTILDLSVALEILSDLPLASFIT